MSRFLNELSRRLDPHNGFSEVLGKLDAIERFLIEQDELDGLGHRIIYDVVSGWSKNVAGCYCPVDKLDKNGFRVKI